jgi:UDP-4-amino-4,6-dideoxy-N-acetyl-beta-L-altrosamine transaminase
MFDKIPYGKQSISEDDINAVVEVLNSDFLTQGPNISAFEEAFAEYIGCKYAIALANGTAALHLSALALGVNENSNVITTPITFVASANCIRYCGGNVYFADINPKTLTLDINAVKELIESKPKNFFQGIIPVDFAGYPVDLEELKELADLHDLWILEDACHAPGAYFIDSKGNKQNSGNGNYAKCSIFSFHPVKHIATGEGGMITTNDELIYKKLLQLRSHGMVYQGNPDLIENHGGWYMEMQVLGFNYRICDIQAALGLSQLKNAAQNLIKRNEIAKRYDNAFKNTNIKIINNLSSIYHAYHLYIIQVENRKELYDKLRKNNIFAQVHYLPVHFMPYYKNLINQEISVPHSEYYYEKCLSIPMYPSLTIEEQEFVINKIIEITNC